MASILPVLKSAGHAVGKEALSTGGRILDKVVEGENVKDSVQKESLKGVDNILEKGGMGRQYGTGTIKRFKTHKHSFTSPKKLIGKSVKLSKNSSPKNISKNIRKRSDAFGFY